MIGEGTVCRLSTEMESGWSGEKAGRVEKIVKSDKTTRIGREV